MSEQTVTRPGITLTREQLESWAGCFLTDDQIDRLDEAVPNSSIPEAIGTIVGSMTDDEDDEEQGLGFDDIPAGFPVQPVEPGDLAADPVTCGTCKLWWDDALVTEHTPVGSTGRCPFEEFHQAIPAVS